MSKSHIKELDDENFEEMIESGVTLVDFFADWCGPCRTLAPVFEELADQMHREVTFGKIDIDRGTHTATKFEITSVPTLVLFKGGKEVNRLEGLQDAETIRKALREVGE